MPRLHGKMSSYKAHAENVIKTAVIHGGGHNHVISNHMQHEALLIIIVQNAVIATTYS